jgi:predicted RNase H-like HicB family nuclease
MKYNIKKNEILYKILIYPADEGGYVAEIISLPSCLAQGETYSECLDELEVVSKLWIEEYLQNYQNSQNKLLVAC